jgi:hypothetical protein
VPRGTSCCTSDSIALPPPRSWRGCARRITASSPCSRAVGRPRRSPGSRAASRRTPRRLRAPARGAAAARDDAGIARRVATSAHGERT